MVYKITSSMLKEHPEWVLPKDCTELQSDINQEHVMDWSNLYHKNNRDVTLCYYAEKNRISGTTLCDSTSPRLQPLANIKAIQALNIIAKERRLNASFRTTL